MNFLIFLRKNLEVKNNLKNMSRDDHYIKAEDDDRYNIRVDMRTEDEKKIENTIEKKWKTTARNRRIIRWKLLRMMQELITNDFDVFTRKVNEDEDLIAILLSDKKVYQNVLQDEDIDLHLRYGLERTNLWEDIMNKPGYYLTKWQQEYEDEILGSDPFSDSE